MDSNEISFLRILILIIFDFWSSSRCDMEYDAYDF